MGPVASGRNSGFPRTRKRRPACRANALEGPFSKVNATASVRRLRSNTPSGLGPRLHFVRARIQPLRYIGSHCGTTRFGSSGDRAHRPIYWHADAADCGPRRWPNRHVHRRRPARIGRASNRPGRLRQRFRLPVAAALQAPTGAAQPGARVGRSRRRQDGREKRQEGGGEEERPAGRRLRRHLARRPARHRLRRDGPHRAVAHLDRHAGPSDSDRSLQHHRQGALAPLEYLQRRTDAVHAADHLVGRGHAHGRRAGLPGLARLHSAARLLRPAVVGYDADRQPRRRRPARDDSLRDHERRAARSPRCNRPRRCSPAASKRRFRHR